MLVSSEYVGDEFHFQLAQLPSIIDRGMSSCTYTLYSLFKMRKENGTWRVYDAESSSESAMAEVPAANMRSDMGRSGHDGYGIPIGIREVQQASSNRIPDEAVEAMTEGKIKQLEPLLAESFREMQSQASAINAEYVDDEFHFRLRMPASKIPDGGEQGMEMSVTPPPDTVTKMRKEEGVRRGHEGEMLD